MDSRELTRQVLTAQKDLYLKPDDRIVFIVDNLSLLDILPDVFWRYKHAAVAIPKIKRPGQDYPLNEALLDGMTVGWLITSLSASHSPATKKMLDRKMFLISNPGIAPDWPAILDPANREPCRRNADAILAAIGGDIGGEVRIQADDGTRLILEVPRANWQKECGERDGLGTNGLYGEVMTAPFSSFGVYVLNPGDFLTNPINKVMERIELHISENMVRQISGGKQAARLRKMLRQSGNPLAFSLGEFAFGINPVKPEKVRRSVVAEKLAGGIHIAIGTNAVCLKRDCPDFWKFPVGRYTAGVHIDAVKFGASVTFNSRMIVNHGKLVV